MISQDQQREILLADFERWNERENGLDPTSRAGIAHASNDRRYMAGIGFLTPPRRYPHAQPRTHYSNAERCEGTSPNMLVTRADGTQTIVPVSSRGRVSKPRTEARTTQAPAHRINAADLAPIGNVE